MTSETNLRLDVDEQFFGLVDDGPGRFHFPAAPILCRPDRMLYGGTAVAIAFAATERTTGKNCIWQTTQFIGTTEVGTRIDVAVDIVAPGRTTNQVQVTGSVDGRVIFVSLGAAVETNDDGHTGQIESPIEVPPPEECPKAAFGSSRNRWFMGLDGRVALEAGDETNTRVWSRFEDGLPLTAARLAFIADLIPMGIARGVGRYGIGLSLDNTLRVGKIVDSEWVLIDVRGHQAMGGYGYGSVHLWTPEWHLLASGSQTAKLTPVDFESLCRSEVPLD